MSRRWFPRTLSFSSVQELDDVVLHYLNFAACDRLYLVVN